MKYKQTKKLNLDIEATRGWCLKYVDDVVGAVYPDRTPNAQTAFMNEVHAKRLKNGPVPDGGVWFPGFLTFKKGKYVKLGHTFLIRYDNGKGLVIRDSETQAGVRAPYGSIAELLAWFSAYDPVYEGWSTHIDNVEVAVLVKEELKPTPEPKPDGFKVGDVVVPIELVDYNGTSLRRYDSVYTITEVIGDRAVLSARGYIWAAMKTSNIRKA